MRAGDSLATRVFRGVNALFVRDDAELTAVIVHFTVLLFYTQTSYDLG